jgi:hypothetical protein
MGQYKLWVAFSWQFLIGGKWERNYQIEIHFVVLTIGIGLTENASGFGFRFF